MATPALLILASASLVASALVRMARVVDRARFLATVAHEKAWDKAGMTLDQLHTALERHATRARYAERAIALLYAAVVVFILACLSIAFVPAIGQSQSWIPVMLAIAGTLLLLGGGAWMVAESRLSGAQIAEEIGAALSRLEGGLP